MDISRTAMLANNHRGSTVKSMAWPIQLSGIGQRNTAKDTAVIIMQILLRDLFLLRSSHIPRTIRHTIRVKYIFLCLMGYRYYALRLFSPRFYRLC